jgi:hypothetical protein
LLVIQINHRIFTVVKLIDAYLICTTIFLINLPIVKSLLQTYLEQEIWILIREKWYFATIIGVWDDLLWFKHRTYNKDTEEDTLWEMVVKIGEVIAIDKVKSVMSRKPEVLISRLLEMEQGITDYQQEHEH